MTHPNFVTNGASLEDCHTNFFALADLSGIKWRRLSCESVLRAEPLEDPVLSSFSKCLNSDIICVWRRVSRAGGQGGGQDGGHGPPHHPGAHPHHAPGRGGMGGGPMGTLGPPPEIHNQLHYNKELWIFWYGEEPDLSGLVSQELTGDPDEPSGSWEHGLSYECRGLLFKALHNLIERCLLAKGYTRLGKWFTEPKEKSDKPRSAQLTFSLNFFIHGESTICASVDVRHHPTVYKLTRQNLLSAQGGHSAANSTGVKVILSPYGLAGTLTGQSYKDNDPAVQRLLNEWRQFYPLPVQEVTTGKDYLGDDSQVPRVVEVFVAGAKLRYPSSYVHVIETEEDVCRGGAGLPSVPNGLLAVGQSRGGAGGVLTPPISPSDPGCCVGGVNRPHAQRYGPGQPMGSALRNQLTGNLTTDPNLNNLPAKQCQWTPNSESHAVLHAKNNIWQDSTVSNQPLTPEASPEDAIGHWEFQDPSARASCNCFRCKIKTKGSSSSPGSGCNKNSSNEHAKQNASLTTTNASSNATGTTNKIKTEKLSEKSNEKTSSRLKGMTPFHRRSPVLDCLTGIDNNSQNSSRDISSNTNNGGGGGSGGNGSGQNSNSTTSFQFNLKQGSGGPVSAVLPSLRVPTPSSSLPTLQTSNANSHGNMESPHPATPGFQSMENSGGSTSEPAMPTLSPHPPILSQEDDNVKTESQEQNSANVITQSPMSVTDPNSNQPIVIKTEKPDQIMSPYQHQQPGSNLMADCKAENSPSVWQPPSTTQSEDASNSAILTTAVAAPSSQAPNSNGNAISTSVASPFPNNNNNNNTNGVGVKPLVSLQGLKRPPTLPAVVNEETDEEDLRNGLLYDYSSLLVNTWESSGNRKRQRIGTILPSGFSNPYSAEMYSRDLNSQSEDSQPSPPKDPYEFNDEFDEDAPPTSGATFRIRNDSVVKDEETKNGAKDPSIPLTPDPATPNGGVLPSSKEATPKQLFLNDQTSVTSPATSTNQASSFTREKDLLVTDRDLDCIFDTSSDDNSDDNFQPPSTPSSVKLTGTSDDAPVTKTTKTSSNSCTAGILGAAELTRMFPTPPSLEHNAVQSPSGPLTLSDIAALEAGEGILGRDKIDGYINCGSPGMDADWSYVYKVPIQLKFVSSSRYSALTSLPSASLPPITFPGESVYKPSWTQNQQQQVAAQNSQQNQQQSFAANNSSVPSTVSSVSATPGNLNLINSLSSGGNMVPMHGPHAGGGPHMQQQQQQLAQHQHHMHLHQQHPHGHPHAHMMHPQQHPHHQLHHPGHAMGPGGLPPPLGHPALMMERHHHPHQHPGAPQHPGHPMMMGGPDPDQRGMMPPGYPGAHPSMMDTMDQRAAMAMNYEMQQQQNHNGPCLPKHPLHSMGPDGPHHLGPPPPPMGPPHHLQQQLQQQHPHQLQSHHPAQMHPSHLAQQQHVHHPHANPQGHAHHQHMMMTSGNGGGITESHSLVTNLVLSDTMMNLYKDHNFAGCTICVCNMNIKGADYGLYLPNFLLPDGSEELQYKCTCGFSAVVNRHYSHRSGLFYEDEVEITGVAYEPPDRTRRLLMVDKRKALPPPPPTTLSDALGFNNNNNSGNNAKDARGLLESLPHHLLDLIRSQCSTLFSTCSVYHKAVTLHNLDTPPTQYNALEASDFGEMCFLALETGRQMLDNMGANGKLDEGLKSSSLHKWPFIVAKPPESNHETVNLLRSLQPLLQEAVHKKRTQMLWEVTYTVSGPLTWRQFHRLAGRGTDDQCEPQPIPSLLVGYEKDWLGISPFALKFWDKLLLEPYPMSRDIAYVVVAPDNDFVLSRLRTYFKELSSIYEVSRLGRHCPVKKIRDGILRVGKNTYRKVANEAVDEWFNNIGNGPVASKLKLYAQVCRHLLVPFLAQQTFDKSLMDPPAQMKPPEKPAASPMPPSTPESQQDKDMSQKSSDGAHSDSQQDNANHSSSGGTPTGAGSSGSQGGGGGGGSSGGGTTHEPEQDDEQNLPALIIYIVEPFSYNNMSPEMYRLSTIGLMRCYLYMLKFLPEHILNNIHVQLITMDSVLSIGNEENGVRVHDELKELAFSIFSQCRRVLTHQSNVKSLTGFGPAATQDIFLKGKNDKNTNPYRMLTLPFILAPQRDKQTELGEMFGDRREKSSILFCNYCLTSDQRWLLASCTNEKGELLETCCINIEIPNRTRRKKASARKAGLTKLLDFIMGVLSNSIQPWRLVVGRLGRIGHGELREWALLLSKKSLLRYSRQLCDLCHQCSVLSPPETPSILSACLVSLEPDSALRIMPDQFTPDARFSNQNCDLSTPEDATCTHILVFPTSATAQSTHATFQHEHLSPLDPSISESIFMDLNEEDIAVDDDMRELFGDFGENGSPGNSPRRDSISQPGSPNGMGGGRHSPFPFCSKPNRPPGSRTNDVSEEPVQLLQQPLALGYYVSTAKVGPLPKWFWSSCPHLENKLPSFLKSALLFHSSLVQSSEEFINSNNQQQRNYHPLDSNFTTDVLRYVLEGYNTLSWLSLDPVTHDRRSCLPVHIQVLMQLYHAMETLT